MFFCLSICKKILRSQMSILNMYLSTQTTEKHHMTYEEAAQHLEISPTEARREIEKQGEDWQEFVNAFGVQSVYYSDDVLEWLGW
jgi:hypothetical protein